VIKPRKIVARFRWAIVSMGTIALLAAIRIAYLDEQGNFQVITSSEAYRSAQLDEDELKHYLSKYKIRAVINLRGKQDDESWYIEEKQVCSDLDVEHYDLRLPADKEPASTEIEALMRLFDTAPRPVLIHCKAGADRSGLAAAIWKMEIDGQPKAVAKRQLSIRFGHIPMGPTSVLDAFIEKWKHEDDTVQTSKVTALKNSFSQGNNHVVQNPHE
jgi:protein tyrosine/serine phosphatase